MKTNTFATPEVRETRKIETPTTSATMVMDATGLWTCGVNIAGQMSMFCASDINELLMNLRRRLTDPQAVHAMQATVPLDSPVELF
jgi:hypothetical protein